jgi:HEAT repeat protein
MMRIFVLLLFLFSTSTPIIPGVSIAPTQNCHDEIQSLLKLLIAVETTEGQKTVIKGPSLNTQQHVRDRLQQLANESSESRAVVIDALIRILEDPNLREEFVTAHRWTTAVYVLGELRAIEGIEQLVKSLDHTGENGIISSIHYRPVTSAIAKIGEPAIPRLIEALSDEKEGTRHHAASALARIGRQTIVKLREALHYGSAETKGGAALALAWIGGDEARAAVEHAIESETDEEALSKLKEGLKEMRRVWGK